MTSKYTRSAKDQECQVRISGVCNYNRETTVLAHLPYMSMGSKSKDIHGAYACSSCHDEIDRRTQRVPKHMAYKDHLEAVIRTQEIMIKDGVLVL